jgi:protein phosphatase
MQTLPSELQIGAAQEQGNRKEQQDYFAVIDLVDQKMPDHQSAPGWLVILADGMGGHAKSGNASIIAINTFAKYYQEAIAKSISIPNAISQALTAANQAVFEANQKMNADMGTTLVACVIYGKKLYWISVGDSSLYLYTKGKLTKINQSHSYGAEIQEKLNAGLLTPEQAQLDPKKRRLLTSYLGLEKIPKIDFPTTYYELELGNKILLCSDGLDNALSQAEIEKCLQREIIAQEKCDRLMAAALGKKHQNQDNITIILSELEPKTENTKTYSGITHFANDLNTENEHFHKILDLFQNKWLVPISLLLLLMILVSSGIFIYNNIWILRKNPVVEENLPNTSNTLVEGNNESENGNQDSMEPTTTSPDEPVDNPPQPIIVNPDEPVAAEPPQQKKCDNGLTLRDIQKKLKDSGYYQDDIDGDWGPNTRKAVEQYQKEKQITPSTGYLDPTTCQSLESQLKESDKPPPVPAHQPGQL